MRVVSKEDLEEQIDHDCNLVWSTKLHHLNWKTPEEDAISSFYTRSREIFKHEEATGKFKAVHLHLFPKLEPQNTSKTEPTGHQYSQTNCTWKPDGAVCCAIVSDSVLNVATLEH